MMRRLDSGWALVVLLVSAIAITAVLTARAADTRPKPGSADRDLGRPVRANSGAVTALEHTMRAWAQDCHGEPASPDGEYTARLDAIARVTCESAGGLDATGGLEVNGYAYSSAKQLDRDVVDIRDVFTGSIGPCTAGRGLTEWVDRGGTRRGAILCGRDGTYAYVYWTDRKARRRYVVITKNQGVAYAWWTRTIRAQGRFPTAAERRLMALTGTQVDRRRCKRSVYESPLSIAAVSCDGARSPGGDRLGADFIEFALFRSVTDLHTHITSERDAFAPSIRYDSKKDTAVGGDAPTYSIWRSRPDRKPRGRLLAFPANSIFFVAWTLDAEHLYARVGRMDQRQRETYGAYEKVGVIGLNP